MKKILCFVMVLLFVMAVPVAADSELEITLQPQNYNFPTYSVAMYVVKATGSNLQCTWYLEYAGNTYNLSDNTNGMEPWEAYAGETYGGNQPDSNTFVWFFGGIEEGLNGAQIWCVIEDGHYDVTSEKAIITVQGDVMPPEILDVPAAVTAYRGDSVELRCVARSSSDAQLEFQWYETSTGKLQDIMAIQEESADFLFCSTEAVGTRYYVCCVTSTDGGRAYSNMIPVTVLDWDPEPELTDPPETTVPAQAPDPTAEPENTEPVASEEPVALTEKTPEITEPQMSEPAGGMPWWGILLIAVAAAGAGVGAAFLILRKK